MNINTSPDAISRNSANITPGYMSGFGNSFETEALPDGRKIHDVFLFEVKKPSESKGAWDYYKQRSVIPAAQAFRPLDQGECPLVKK